MRLSPGQMGPAGPGLMGPLYWGAVVALLSSGMAPVIPVWFQGPEPMGQWPRCAALLGPTGLLAMWVQLGLKERLRTSM